jgi:regulator of protease activity HflC (stomatin/prohibitin superfamily)
MANIVVEPTLRRGGGASGLSSLLSLIALAGAGLCFWRGAISGGAVVLYTLGGLLVIVALLIPQSLRMANQWERAIVLRLGRLHAIRGPGLFIVIPFIDAVPTWLDQRIQTTEFDAEEALSKDTVPINIDAVIFWQIHDPERAALEITDYRSAIQRVAQTSLREMVGASDLHTLLSDRKVGDDKLREDIGRKIADWGVSVISVEIRDIGVPQALQDAMSRQAQAQRERQARILLGQAEQEVAQKFVEAAEIYAKSPTALQLRAMNIIYETTKERGATVLIPSQMVDAMNPGGILGLVAAAQPPAPPAPEPATVKQAKA